MAALSKMIDSGKPSLSKAEIKILVSITIFMTHCDTLQFQRQSQLQSYFVYVAGSVFLLISYANYQTSEIKKPAPK